MIHGPTRLIRICGSFVWDPGTEAELCTAADGGRSKMYFSSPQKSTSLSVRYIKNIFITLPCCQRTFYFTLTKELSYLYFVRTNPAASCTVLRCRSAVLVRKLQEQTEIKLYVSKTVCTCIFLALYL